MVGGATAQHRRILFWQCLSRAAVATVCIAAAPEAETLRSAAATSTRDRAGIRCTKQSSAYRVPNSVCRPRRWLSTDLFSSKSKLLLETTLDRPGNHQQPGRLVDLLSPRLQPSLIHLHSPAQSLRLTPLSKNRCTLPVTPGPPLHALTERVSHPVCD